MTKRNTTRRSTFFMALVGAVTTALALTVPGTPGGAADGEEPTTTSSSTTSSSLPTDALPLPVTDANALQAQVKETVVPTTTTTVPPTTTTTAPQTTATTAPQTTATTAPPAQATSTDEPDQETVSAASAEGFDWANLPPLPPPPLEIPLITAFRMDEAYAGYTPVGGRRSTKDLFDTLARIEADDAKKRDIVAPFPVYGVANYSDDWGAPRYTPYPHQHEGTDVFAAAGTPIIAPMRSVVRSISPNTGAGGNAVYLALPDGTYLYFAHLAAFADGLHPGQVVEAGTVIGTVGDSGNAEGGTPHLHFEIHPGGGEAVPPVTYLDAWLASANAEAKALAGTAPVTAGANALPAQLDATPDGEPVFGTLAGNGSGASNNIAGPLVIAVLILGFALRHHLQNRPAAPAPAAPVPLKPVLVRETRVGRQVVTRHRAPGLARLFDQHSTVQLRKRGLVKAANALRRERTEAGRTEEAGRVLETTGSR